MTAPTFAFISSGFIVAATLAYIVGALIS